MKRHKSFDAYLRAQDHKVTPKIKLLMMDVWTNARYGYIDTQPDELVGQRGNRMFIRINTLRINCDLITSYKPIQDSRVNHHEIVINYSNGSWDALKFSTSNELVRVLVKLDGLLHCKKNLASRLPKDN